MVSTRRRRRPRQGLLVLGVVFAALVVVALVFHYGDTTPAGAQAQTGEGADMTATGGPTPPSDTPIAGAGSGASAFEDSRATRTTGSGTQTTAPSDSATAPRADARTTSSTTTAAGTTGKPATKPAAQQQQVDRSVTSGSTSGGSAPRLGIDVQTPFRRGMKLIADGELVRGRTVLSGLLTDETSQLSADQAAVIRNALNDVSRDLIFSATIHTDDPLTSVYTVKAGDALSRIAPRYNLTHSLLAMINRIDPNKIRAGQRLKLIHGPFHVVIDKSDYRLDLFLHDSEQRPVYIYSLPIGLGEADSTPVGSWIVSQDGKVLNPSWRNPRTGEYFARGDPNNPLGKYWIGLQGTDETTKPLDDYGIHGTIEPDSIGRQMSMGCVRLRDQDIELLYHLLVEGKSTVRIQP